MTGMPTPTSRPDSGATAGKAVAPGVSVVRVLSCVADAPEDPAATAWTV